MRTLTGPSDADAIRVQMTPAEPEVEPEPEPAPAPPGADLASQLRQELADLRSGVASDFAELRGVLGTLRHSEPAPRAADPSPASPLKPPDPALIDTDPARYQADLDTYVDSRVRGRIEQLESQIDGYVTALDERASHRTTRESSIDRFFAEHPDLGDTPARRQATMALLENPTFIAPIAGLPPEDGFRQFAGLVRGVYGQPEKAGARATTRSSGGRAEVPLTVEGARGRTRGPAATSPERSPAYKGPSTMTEMWQARQERRRRALRGGRSSGGEE